MAASFGLRTLNSLAASTTGTDCGTANALSLDGLGVALNTALSGTPFQFPQAVCHQDNSSPFRIDATLGRWQIDESGSGNRIEITIASGTLRDIDKGIFPLSSITSGAGLRAMNGRRYTTGSTPLRIKQTAPPSRG